MGEALLRSGRYVARFAAGRADVDRAQALRHRVFRGGHPSAAGDVAFDADRFDLLCRHLLVEARADGALAGCLRLLRLSGGARIGESYSAQFYDLARIEAFRAPVMELGRLCIAPGARDPDILRTAWAAVAAEVDATGTGLLFGCSSFAGTDPRPHEAALTLLAARHLAPRRWAPSAKAPAIVTYARTFSARPVELRAGLAGMPSPLRSYLGMGGWVSDHAVVDRDLNTLHVFTGLEIDRVPTARARVLRAVSG